MLFIEHSWTLVEFSTFFLTSSVFFRKYYDKLAEAIARRRKPPGKDLASAKAEGDRLRSFYEFGIHERFTSEVIVSRVVDNFLAYLKDLLALVYRSRPETLKSGEQERLDFILEHSTMDELVAAVAQKRVEEASFKGMRELAEYFDKLGLKLFPSSEAMERAIRIVELRNLIVHNRGVVNSIFKRRVPDYPAKIGDHIQLDFGIASDYQWTLNNAAFEIDQRAAKKFDLARVPLGDVESRGLAHRIERERRLGEPHQRRR